LKARRPVRSTSPSAIAFAGRSAKAFTDTMAPTWLATGTARGAAARNWFSAPHSSASKWEKAT
jgi:hypothetical protein